jgi:hypothetical protein
MGVADGLLIDVIMNLEQQLIRIKDEQADATSSLDKRALAVALTHLETAQLWLANSRPD